ncbi:MAG: response regulator transcription factor [Eubacteriales bacterium]
MKLIYVADDDKNICTLLKSHIENEGYIVEVFSNGRELLERFNEKPCDMVITDIVMPQMGGYDLCKEIRRASMIPVFMISANNEEIDRVLGLELGSDDYISKPISFRELNAKIKNTFKRIEIYENPKEGDKDEITIKDLTLNKANRQVFIGGELLQTTAKEFEMLLLFLNNINRAFTREQIIEKIWGYDYYGDSRQVDHMIKRLRKKMLEAEAQCQIETVWGFGYKIGE